MTKTQMITAQINLPLFENNGISPLGPLHTRLKGVLLDIAGGYSAYNANGAWRDNSGQEVKEEVIIYQFSLPATNLWEVIDTVNSIVDNLLILSQQEAVYYQIGQAAFIAERTSVHAIQAQTH